MSHLLSYHLLSSFVIRKCKYIAIVAKILHLGHFAWANASTLLCLFYLYHWINNGRDIYSNKLV